MTGRRERRGRRGPSASWGVLELRVPEILEDEVIGLLAADSLGARIVPAGRGEVLVRVFLAAPSEAARLAGTARRMLERLGRTAEASSLRWKELRDGRWAERYQEGLRPFSLGRGFLVVPGGEPTQRTGRSAVLLVPGRAFGTGEHPTTRLCAAALERWVRPGSRWLDLGTGSGILAVVAARCGASRVSALDVDPEAVEVAREVIRANGEERRITARAGTLGEDATLFDGIVANISAAFFLDHSKRAAEALEPGGLLVASGFLREEKGRVVRALEEAGLDELEESHDGAWAMTCARRRKGNTG